MPVVVVDGLMCEDIRVGMLIRLEMGRLMAEAKGEGWRRKDGASPVISFSSSLLEHAGGVRKLLEEWEPWRHAGR